VPFTSPTFLFAFLPAAQPAPFSAFNVAWGRSPGGDLAAMAGIQGIIGEPIPGMAPKNGFQAKPIPVPDYATLRPWPHL